MDGAHMYYASLEYYACQGFSMVGAVLNVQDGRASQGHAASMTYPRDLYTTLITMRNLLLEGTFSVS